MTEVVIAGIGQTPVGEHWEISLRDLALAAIQAALEDSGGLRPQALFVGNMLAPNLSNQAHLGALIADHCGLTGIEAVNFEAVQGLPPTGQAALLMRRYMHEHGVPADGFAGFAVAAHANGAGNKYAM